MKYITYHRKFTIVFQLWSFAFLCYFLLFFAFRNNCSYLFKSVAEFVSLESHYELWDDQISSETEIEKLEVVCSDLFLTPIIAFPSLEEQPAKHPIACPCNVLHVYLEILGPPPWHIAYYSV